MVRFFLKLLTETENSCCASRFPLTASCYQHCWQPNFIHFILRSRSRKFWKGRFTFDSATPVETRGLWKEQMWCCSASWLGQNRSQQGVQPTS